MQIEELRRVVESLNAEDAFAARLQPEQWRTLAPYLTRHDIRAGDLLVKQGDVDRTMYLLGHGTLQAFVSGGLPGPKRIAILRAGSIIGEPGLFDDGPRMANIEAMTACVVWALRGPRFGELALTNPVIALEVLRAAGGVMAVRMRSNLAKQTPFA